MNQPLSSEAHFPPFLCPRRSYGFLDPVLHHIGDTHVAHHLFSYMPHYHAQEATQVRSVHCRTSPAPSRLHIRTHPSTPRTSTFAAVFPHPVCVTHVIGCLAAHQQWSRALQQRSQVCTSTWRAFCCVPTGSLTGVGVSGGKDERSLMLTQPWVEITQILEPLSHPAIRVAGRRQAAVLSDKQVEQQSG